MPKTVHQILQEVAIGVIVGVIAVVVWVLTIGPDSSPWQYLVANVVLLLAAGFTASAWSRWRAGRRASKEVGR